MEVSLRTEAADGQPLVATFVPSKGMNLISFRKGEIEAIAQSTWGEFEERSAGLGALIGPHFHHRPDHAISEVPHEERFPHIARVRAKGVKEPFSHGIGRYAPWTYVATSTEIHATLSGQDLWNGVELSRLEGQSFHMHYRIHLAPDGLHLELSVTSERPSVVGFHTYYDLVDGKGSVTSQVQNKCRDHDEWRPIPATWDYRNDGLLVFPVDEAVDLGFQPPSDRRTGEIVLLTGDHRVRVRYGSDTQDHSWQLWHPKGKPFVCIEPVSAVDPRDPSRTSSTVTAHLQIHADE